VPALTRRSAFFEKGTKRLNQPKELLQIRLRRPLAKTLEEMWAATRPCETKITIETYASMLLEAIIVDHRSKRIPSAARPNNRANHIRNGSDSYPWPR
jgi:hypothetical protein